MKRKLSLFVRVDTRRKGEEIFMHILNLRRPFCDGTHNKLKSREVQEVIKTTKPVPVAEPETYVVWPWFVAGLVFIGAFLYRSNT
jgi:trehalose utilization protein